MKFNGPRQTVRARVRDVTLGAGEASVEAFVVEPAGGNATAGILFLHWLGDRRSDRTQFLTEAKDYARLGIRCVLPAGRLPWGPDPVDAPTDIANLELEQERLRAALDAVSSWLPDGAPVALVGHDFGAMHGIVLAAGNPGRFAATVVIAATPRWGDWFLRFWPMQVDRHEYLRALAPYDPVTVARGLTSTTLWQASDRDFFIAPMSTVELARAQPLADGAQPAIEWYAADHAMRSAKARASRRGFLLRELGLA